MEQATMQQLTIDEWTKQLCAIPKQDFTIPRVLKFTQEKAIRPETLAPYLFYANSHYTRNLIYKCELFEVLAICWNVGQVSRIHNHRDQNCWMVTPIGRLRVQNFRVENRDTRARRLQAYSHRFLRHGRHPSRRRFAGRTCASGVEPSRIRRASDQRSHLFLSICELRSVFDGSRVVRRCAAALFERIWKVVA